MMLVKRMLANGSSGEAAVGVEGLVLYVIEDGFVGK